MGTSTSPIPDPADSSPPRVASSPAEAAPEAGQHDFDAQKRIHQQIRNDPDYDDWEYGTEPLPHEAWIAGRRGGGSPPSPQPTGEGPSAGG